MKEFEKVFKLPLKLDLWGNYVWDDQGNMVLQFNEDENGWPDVDKQNNIIDWLNDVIGTVKPTIGSLSYNPKISSISENGRLIIDIRGWGYLTGVGGLNMGHKEAVKIQDDLADFIIKKLTR